MHRRLSTILYNLKMSEQFRTSRQIVEIAGHGEFTVADFFVRFSAVAPASASDNQYHGYWGLVASARLDQEGKLWLNSGGHDDMSVCVKEQFITELYKRFKIEDEGQLADRYVLIVGRLRVSQRGKKYVLVEDIGYITLSSRDF